ncbi:uncharacterized protein RBU33_014431 isoform 1-T1 [Hipposideros larvatus]
MYQPTEEPLLHFSDKCGGALFTPLGPSRLELCPALAASTVGCSSDSVKGNQDGTRSVPKPRGDLRPLGGSSGQVREQPALRAGHPPGRLPPLTKKHNNMPIVYIGSSCILQERSRMIRISTKT